MKSKNMAVFCVCRNESKFLPLWVNHYANQFGLENIYVFDDCSTDGCFDGLDLINYELCNFNRAGVERLGAHNYPVIWHFIVKKYIELLEQYKYVANIDTDEFIIPNPEKYKNLKHYIENLSKPYVRCRGYEIIQRPDELALDWNMPILNQRNYYARQTNVDKPCITSVKLAWHLGNHYVKGKQNEPTESDLILFHLHRVDYDNYKKKYFVVDDRIKTFRDFINLYGGYPMFYIENDLRANFDNVNSHRKVKVVLEEIPEKYKGAF